MSCTTSTDTSLWDFVGREIHKTIATELEQEHWHEEEVEDNDEKYVDASGELVGYGGKMVPDFLNGERSMQIPTSSYLILVQDSCEHDDSNERIVDDNKGLRELILSSASVEEAVEKFAQWNASLSNCSRGRNDPSSMDYIPGWPLWYHARITHTICNTRNILILLFCT
jgi:hypothetical protein